MITLVVSILCLIFGYVFYGKYVARIFGIDSARETPVQRRRDGVDYIEISPWRAFMIQLLNIAGLGPIFGAILGAAYGPVAYVWIVLGCIFMGAAHDFFAGAISMRTDGSSLPDIVGKHLGNGMRRFLVLFSSLMLLAVGVAFVTGPAGLLAEQSTFLARNFSLDGIFSENGLALPFAGTLGWIPFWTSIIVLYYVAAVLLPIDKIIGRIYPLFSIALIFMVVGVAGAMILKSFAGTLEIPELTLSSLKNYHANADANPIFPMLFIVISCGAISGFHATQSPMIARCLTNEKFARPIFYGAMIAEGMIAMIWATAAMAYCGGADGLNASGKPPAVIVNEICADWLGTIGAVAAILGVIICPISSGDTALRSVRLIVADAISISQKPLWKRLLVSLPIFALALALSQIRFEIIWRYVGLANQTLAAITLWACSVWLARNGKPHWILSIPAAFLSSVCISYFLYAPHNVGGLALQYQASCIAGTLAGIALLAGFAIANRRSRGNTGNPAGNV